MRSKVRRTGTLSPITRQKLLRRLTQQTQMGRGMRTVLAFVSLLLVTASSRAADPVYLDQLIETPLATLQTQFEGLRKEGCYQVAPGRYLLLTLDKKDGKPWRVALSAAEPCRKPIDGP